MPKIFLIFFGPPGSGKGTQVQKIAEKLRLPVISTGDLLRREVENKTELGRIAKRYMSRGKLVPDEMVAELVSHRLQRPDARAGAIFDGYPRREEQQETLLGRFKRQEKAGGKVYAILVDTSDQEVRERLSGRRACICGAVYHLKFNPPKQAGRCDLDGKKLFIREDDKPAVITKRLKSYHDESQPLFDYWQKQGKLIRINGEQAIDKVWQELERELRKRGFKI